MDWTSKVNFADRMLDKYGAEMTLTVSSTGTYVGTTDSYNSTTTDYSVKGVITNPNVQNQGMTWGLPGGDLLKSDQTRVLLSGSIDVDLETADFKITYGDKIWYPDNVRKLQPGGTAIMYYVDVK